MNRGLLAKALGFILFVADSVFLDKAIRQSRPIAVLNPALAGIVVHAGRSGEEQEECSSAGQQGRT